MRIKKRRSVHEFLNAGGNLLAEFASNEKWHEIKLDFSFASFIDIKSNNTYRVCRGVFVCVCVCACAWIGVCVCHQSLLTVFLRPYFDYSNSATNGAEH